MSDHPVFGKMRYYRRPFDSSFAPMDLLVWLQENNCDGLIYNHIVPRAYYGNWDFTGGGAKGRIDASGYDGLPLTGQVFNFRYKPSDGMFWDSMPLGAMPLEQATAIIADVTSGMKKGVYFLHGPWVLWKFPPYGFIYHNDVNKVFFFISSAFKVYGPYRVHHPDPYTGPYRPYYFYYEGNRKLSCLVTTKMDGDWFSGGCCHVETWTPEIDGGLLYSHVANTMFHLDTYAQIDCHTQPPQTPYPTQYTEYYACKVGPTFKGAGGANYNAIIISDQGGFWRNRGYLRADGYWTMSTWAWAQAAEGIWYSPDKIERYHYEHIPRNECGGWGKYLQLKITTVLVPSDIDANFSGNWEAMHDEVWPDVRVSYWDNWYIMKLPCGTYFRFVAIDRDTSTVVHSLIWTSDYSDLYEFPTGARVYGGTPYLCCRRIIPGANAVLLNMSNGSEFDWRSVYLWNIPYSESFPRTGMDGTVAMEAWADTVQEEPWQQNPKCVLHGDVTVLTPNADVMYVAGGFTEDISVEEECGEFTYNCRATFIIRKIISQELVSGASVSVRIVVTITVDDETTTVYTGNASSFTNVDGEAQFQLPACFECVEGEILTATFTVTDVSKDGEEYREEVNALNELIWTVDGGYIPGECDYTASPITPSPAAFMSSSPFQQLVSGAWYHIMVAQNASHEDGCVEYKFTCVEDDSLSSDWRSTASVAGTYYPNGTAQVPQQYWAGVSGKNQLYNWIVQYRACVCANGDTPSAPKQVPAVP